MRASNQTNRDYLIDNKHFHVQGVSITHVTHEYCLHSITNPSELVNKRSVNITKLYNSPRDLERSKKRPEHGCSDSITIIKTLRV